MYVCIYLDNKNQLFFSFLEKRFETNFFSANSYSKIVCLNSLKYSNLSI